MCLGQTKSKQKIESDNPQQNQLQTSVQKRALCYTPQAQEFPKN